MKRPLYSPSLLPLLFTPSRLHYRFLPFPFDNISFSFLRNTGAKNAFCTFNSTALPIHHFNTLFCIQTQQFPTGLRQSPAPPLPFPPSTSSPSPSLHQYVYPPSVNVTSPHLYCRRVGSWGHLGRLCVGCWPQQIGCLMPSSSLSKGVWVCETLTCVK